MKYLIMLLFAISSFNLHGQSKDTSNVDDTIKLKERSLEVYYGKKIDEFNLPILGISYMYTITNKVVHSFDAWAFKADEQDLIGAVSTALRYYFLKKNYAKLYIQGGVGMTMLGPLAYGTIGINYSAFFIDIKTIRFGPHLTYLIVGIKL